VLQWLPRRVSGARLPGPQVRPQPGIHRAMRHAPVPPAPTAPKVNSPMPKAKSAKAATALQGGPAPDPAASPLPPAPTETTAPVAAQAPQSPAAERIAELVQTLRTTYPDAACELRHANAFELLVATILSAQCTDERVNMVTPVLFARFPTPAALAAADRDEIETIIKSTGFYRNKAKNIQEAAARIVATYGGEVPQRMEEILTLPGVARKTGNVVLGVAYGLPTGVVVDTHVRRLSNRLGLTTHEDPEKIEKDLMALLPQEEWIDFSHLLIFHGRRCCDARKPNCPGCSVRHLCPASTV
jgi:endonuclease-3